ncbi:hypothetical protein CHS0354_014182, partial [Potamilus streckersoni]
MAFIDELERLLQKGFNETGHPSLVAFFQLENETHQNLSNTQLLEEREWVLWDIVLIVAYASLIIISVFGNTLVCHVVIKNKRMHTVTNFFIANLAVSDLLLTVLNVPFNIARNLLDEWPFGDVMCRLMNFSLMVSVYISTFTLMGIALDRQQVLLYPLSPRMSKPIGLVVLGLIWLIAIGLSLPFGLYNRVQEVDLLLTKAKRCASDFPEPNEKWEQYLTVITIFLQYVFPLTVIAVTYGRIVRKLWVRTHVGAVTENQQATQQKAKRKSIKMLITVVIVFALCWMPLNLYHILTDFHPNPRVFHYSSTVFFICHWIAISSTCYNPFVYCWLNEAFRTEVKSRFRCCLVRSKKVHPGIEIDGMLFRSDRAFRSRRLKSFLTSSSTAKFSSCGGRGLDANARKSEMEALCLDNADITQDTNSPESETSLNYITLSLTASHNNADLPDVSSDPLGVAELPQKECSGEERRERLR